MVHERLRKAERFFHLLSGARAWLPLTSSPIAAPPPLVVWGGGGAAHFTCCRSATDLWYTDTITSTLDGVCAASGSLPLVTLTLALSRGNLGGIPNVTWLGRRQRDLALLPGS